MIIDFEKIKETHIDNFKGGEKYIAAKMFVDNNNKIMFGYIIPGASIGLHTHTESSEIVYILKGKATIIYDNCEEIVHKAKFTTAQRDIHTLYSIKEKKILNI